MNPELPPPSFWVDQLASVNQEWTVLRELIDGESGPVSEMIESRQQLNAAQDVARRVTDEEWLLAVIALLDAKAKAVEAEAMSLEKSYHYDTNALDRFMQETGQATYGQRFDVARDLVSFRGVLVEQAEKLGYAVPQPPPNPAVSTPPKRSFLGRLIGGG